MVQIIYKTLIFPTGLTQHCNRYSGCQLAKQLEIRPLQVQEIKPWRRVLHFKETVLNHFQWVICVYIQHTCVPVWAALKFRKPVVSFQFEKNLEFGTHNIICDVKLLSFDMNYFLYSFSDYLEHQLNYLEYMYWNFISVLNKQKMLTESSCCFTMVISCWIWWNMS